MMIPQLYNGRSLARPLCKRTDNCRADYDLISWDIPHSSPKTHLTSSYVYRKALIRKHQLHLTILEYLAKCDYRGVDSVLGRGGWAKGWRVELQFADELDELLLDELYELEEEMRDNEGREDGDKKWVQRLLTQIHADQLRWFILKPGFADRAQGIRLFSTEEEL
jgi:tubulin--tyrosine ligase